MKMPSTYALKPAFQKLLMPAMEQLRNWGVTPNGLTWSAIVLSASLGWMFSCGLEQSFWFFFVVAGLMLRMVLNALDGMMARSHGMSSKAGAFLNELGDVVSDALVMWPLALLPGMHVGWVGAFLWLAVINEMSGVLGGWLSGERRYDGPMGKSDRTLAWGVLCLLLGFGLNLEPVLPWALMGVMGCLVLSTFLRIHKSLKA